MREIKFRGKSTETKLHTKQWRFGSLLTSIHEDGIYLIFEPFPMPTREGKGYWYEVVAETVGQYTGAKDINGKESYEGDIIKFYDVRAHELVGVIKWNTLACRWYVDCSVRDCPYHVFDARYAFEIIGNVYDNPELLEADNARD